MADTHKKILGNVQLDDGFGDSITSTVVGDKRSLDVNITGGDIIIDNPTIVVDISAFGASPDSVLTVGSEDGTETGIRHVLKVDSDGALFVAQEGVWNTGRTWTLDSSTDSVEVIQGTTPWAVSGPLTNAELRAVDVNINVTNPSLAVTGPLTDAQLRATPVPISGTVTAIPSGTQDVNIISSVSLAVTGPLTDAQLRATDVDVNITNSTLAVTQSTSPWIVAATDLDIRDLVFATDKVDVSGSTLGANSGIDIGDVTVNNATGAAAVNIQDGGNSITVDGTVAISNFPATVAVTQSTSPWVVSGTVIATPSGIQDVNVVSSVEIEIKNDAGSPVPVSGTVAATQSGAWSVEVNNAAGAAAVNIQDGGNSITVDAVDFDIRNLVFATDKVDTSGSTLGANSGVDIGDVTINNAAGAAAVNIQDGGNSITVDAVDLDVRNLTFATDKVDASGTTLGANSGVDIGDVTINNAAGAAAVNIQDGGNSITVDGTVTASNFPATVDTNYGVVGANTVRTAAQIGNATGAANFDAGATGAQTLRVTANAGVNLNTSALALEASLVKLPLAQASTTSGQSGPLVQGAVTTANPTYTTAQTSPLSLDIAGRLRVLNAPTLGVLQTYSAAALVTSAAVATDIFTLTGSASKTIAVVSFMISGVATSATTSTINIIKRSTADTAGTSSAPTRVPHDSANAAATATVLAYTANPTLGTTVGNVRTFKAFLSPPTGGNTNTPSIPTIGPQFFSQPVILRGTAEVLAFNLAGVTITGGVFAIGIEWVEY